MNDNIQSKPPLPSPDSDSERLNRYADVKVRKEEPAKLPLSILLVPLLCLLAGAAFYYLMWTYSFGSRKVVTFPSEQVPLSASVPNSEDPSKNIANGTWHATAMLHDGKLVPVAKGLNVTLIIDRNKFTLTLPEREFTGSWVCRNNATPCEVDFFDATGITIEAIYDYEVADGVLRICFPEEGKPRVKNITDVITRPDTAFTAITFKRNLAGGEP